MQISIFEHLDKSSKPSGQITIEEALALIKNHPKSALIESARRDGKKNLVKKFKDKVWDRTEGKIKVVERNLYEHTKLKCVPVVTWNCLVTEKRVKAKIKSASGFIYFDVDNFSKLIENGKAVDNSTAKAYVRKQLSSNSLPFVKAVWNSFGGDGLGFLVQVKDLTVENFAATWKSIFSMFDKWNITIDTQTKDITRCNVLPSDPTIFIRESVSPYQAVNEEAVDTLTIKTEAMPSELVGDVLEATILQFYDKNTSWSGGSKNSGHICYRFFFDFFSFCNHLGIDLDEALNFLVDKSASLPEIFKHKSVASVENEVIRNIKDYYAEQFGSRTIISENGKYQYFSVYKKYDGDIQLKLAYTWNFLSKKQRERGNLVKYFSTISKENGIFKTDVISFLKTKISFGADEYNTVTKVYGDANIFFGVTKILTEAGLESVKKGFQDWATKNSYRIVQKNEFEGDVFQKIIEFVNAANGIFRGLSEDNFFNFFDYIFKNSKEHAISLEKSLAVLNELLSDETFAEYLKFDSKVFNSKRLTFIQYIRTILNFIGKEVYSFEQWKFGMRLVKTLTHNKIRERYNIKEEYFLERGQYINEVEIPNDRYRIIWGNTGQGKTTWICGHTKGKRLVLVPIVSLLKGIYKEYESSIYYQDKKNVQEGDDLIICTYSSFPNLLKIMKKWENVKISDYDMYVDEEHNFAVSASPDYRGFELNNIVDNFHIFNSVTLLTGTKFPVLHPVFAEFVIYRANWAVTPEKECTPIRFNNILYAIETKLSREGKNLIYLQNKKEEGQMGALVEYLSLKGWDKSKIWLINADEKDSDNFNSLINNQRVDEDIQIVICTSVIVEGINIYNADFKTVHFMTPESPINMEQMVNRLRDVYTKGGDSDCMIYTYRSINAKTEPDTDHVDVIEVQKKLIETAEQGLDLFSKAYVTGDSVSYKTGVKLFGQQLFGKSSLYRNDNGFWEIDYLSIANMAYIEEKNYANKNIDFMQVMLSEYNWKFNPEEHILEEISAADLMVIKEHKAIKKEELLQDVLEIIEDIKEEGEDVCIMKVEDTITGIFDDFKRPQYQIALRAKVRYLCNNLTFEESVELVEEWVNIHGMSDRIWSKIVRQINVQVAAKLDIFAKSKDNSSEIAKKLFTFYKKNKTKEKRTKEKTLFTQEDLKSTISELTGRTEESSVSLFKAYFDIEEKLVADKLCYTIEGIKVTNEVATFTWKLNEWATEMFDNGTLITNEELAFHLNKLRADLPILGLYKLDTRTSMKLIHDYFDFERTSAKMVKGKKTNTYSIKALSPKELDGYTVIPMRKIEIEARYLDDLTNDERYEKFVAESLGNIAYQATMSKESEMFLMNV